MSAAVCHLAGPGNWAAVAEHVGTKSKAACKEHYFQIYIEPRSCPLPTPAPEMAGVSKNTHLLHTDGVWDLRYGLTGTSACHC